MSSHSAIKRFVLQQLENCNSITLDDCNQLFQSITVSAAESRLFEMLTSRQCECEYWYKQRELCLTASIFHDVYDLKTNPPRLLTRLTKPKELTTIPAVQLGYCT